MKPRHYSPSEACEEESEDLAPPQDKEELRNIDTPAGKQMSCCFVCFDEQLTLNFKIPSVAFIFPLSLPSASSHSHCAVEVKDYTAGSTLVVSHVHKMKFWQLICHDISGVALPAFWWGQISDPSSVLFHQPVQIHSILRMTHEMGECTHSLSFKLNFFHSFKPHFCWTCLLWKANEASTLLGWCSYVLLPSLYIAII